MKKGRDPRINVGFSSFKEYILLFWSLAAFNGFHMWLYQEFTDRGLFITNIKFVINFLVLYVSFATLCITVLVAIVRHISWNQPMRKLSEAARKIAQGDFSVHITPLRKDGKKDYVEVMFDDFNTMVQELQSIETLKTDFIAGVSHEIKTPLAVIQSYAAALESSSLQTDVRNDYIKTIIEASQKLSTLVSNILKLNKLENQEILSKALPFNLGEQLRRCTVAFEDLFERKNINFELELEEITVCYDETLLEIIWNNLLSNAVKFTGEGGSILIRLKAQDDCARVSISDTGCGMDKNIQKRIFDKFYQADNSHTQEGNGLGLALVKRTVELVNGTVTVDSSAGKGSTFTVCLKI